MAAYLKAKQAPEVADQPVPKSEFLWRAFHDLRGSRQNGFGPGAIPLAAIEQYADLCGLTCPVSRYRLLSVVTHMDACERGYHGRTKADA